MDTDIPAPGRPLRAGAALVVLAAALAGCIRFGYVVQAGLGQLHLWTNARPIADVLDDPATDPHTRALLSEVEPILAFARARGLASKGNYTKYVELDRSAVVWFMAVSDPLAFEPEVWRFPIVGSFTYLGWFSQDEARQVGKALEDEGWDVYLRSVRAFSTGGWFRDPVLSTMLRPRAGDLGGDLALIELANVLFHELTHANVFIPDQSTFDESIATFVGDAITEQYLAERFGDGSDQLRAFREAAARGERHGTRMMQAYAELSALYESAAPAAAKRDRKRRILDALDADLHLHYEPNNASLLGFKTYNAGLPELGALFEACGRDWHRFLASVKTLDSASFGASQADDIGPTIAGLTRAGCPGSGRKAPPAARSDIVEIGAQVAMRGHPCSIAAGP